MKKYKNNNERRLAEAKRMSQKAKTLISDLESQGFKVNQYTKQRVEDVAKRKRFTNEQLKDLRRLTSETNIRKGSSKYLTYKRSGAKDESFRVTAYKTDEQIAGKSYDMIKRAVKNKSSFGVKSKQNALIKEQLKQLKMFTNVGEGVEKTTGKKFDWDLKEKSVEKNLEKITKSEYVNAVKYMSSFDGNQSVPDVLLSSSLFDKENVKTLTKSMNEKSITTFKNRYKSATGEELSDGQMKVLNNFFNTPLWQEWRAQNRGRYDLQQMINEATDAETNTLNFEAFQKSFVYETVDNIDEGKTILKLTNLLIEKGFLA